MLTKKYNDHIIFLLEQFDCKIMELNSLSNYIQSCFDKTALEFCQAYLFNDVCNFTSKSSERLEALHKSLIERNEHE